LFNSKKSGPVWTDIDSYFHSYPSFAIRQDNFVTFVQRFFNSNKAAAESVGSKICWFSWDIASWNPYDGLVNPADGQLQKKACSPITVCNFIFSEPHPHFKGITHFIYENSCIAADRKGIVTALKQPLRKNVALLQKA